MSSEVTVSFIDRKKTSHDIIALNFDCLTIYDNLHYNGELIYSTPLKLYTLLYCICLVLTFSSQCYPSPLRYIVAWFVHINGNVGLIILSLQSMLRYFSMWLQKLLFYGYDEINCTQWTRIVDRTKIHLWGCKTTILDSDGVSKII